MKLPSFFEMYQSLIAIPTISSDDMGQDRSNKALVELLAEWLEILGFKINIQPIQGSNDKYNLLASRGSAHSQGGLLLAGHTDTVPYDIGRWSVDPFTLTELDNKWFGLGTADMKGFFVFVLETLRHLDLDQLKKPLHLLATADEETSMLGARYFTQSCRLKPDMAIIGEPTSLKPIRAHKGHIANAICITGQSGHSSDPSRGINAIELMHEAISQLMQLKQQLQQRYHNPIFAVPYPTLNLGHIHGGDAANRICGYCELHLDIRPLPNLSLDEIDGLVDEALKGVNQRWPQRLTIKRLGYPIPAYECHKNATAIQSIEKLLNLPAETVNYCTEAPYIQQICPTIVWGPGSIEQAHQPDEYMSMEFSQPTLDNLSKIIMHFCY